MPYNMNFLCPEFTLGVVILNPQYLGYSKPEPENPEHHLKGAAWKNLIYGPQNSH